MQRLFGRASHPRIRLTQPCQRAIGGDSRSDDLGAASLEREQGEPQAILRNLPPSRSSL